MGRCKGDMVGPRKEGSGRFPGLRSLLFMLFILCHIFYLSHTGMMRSFCAIGMISRRPGLGQIFSVSLLLGTLYWGLLKGAYEVNSK